MTSEETHKLNLRMAVEVMDRPLVGRYPGEKTGYPCFINMGGEIYLMKTMESSSFSDKNLWSPCTNIAQAFECIEKMREQANITVYGWEDRYAVNQFLRKWNASSTEIHCQYPDLPQTICKVIAQALDMAKPAKEQT